MDLSRRRRAAGQGSGKEKLVPETLNELHVHDSRSPVSWATHHRLHISTDRNTIKRRDERLTSV